MLRICVSALRTRAAAGQPVAQPPTRLGPREVAAFFSQEICFHRLIFGSIHLRAFFNRMICVFCLTLCLHLVSHLGAQSMHSFGIFPRHFCALWDCAQKRLFFISKVVLVTSRDVNIDSYLLYHPLPGVLAAPSAGPSPLGRCVGTPPSRSRAPTTISPGALWDMQ